MSAVVAVLLLAVSAWPLGRRLAAALPPAASPACRIATEILAGLIVHAGLVHVLVCIGVPLKGAFGCVGAVGVGAAVIGPTPAARGSSPLPRMFGPLVALVIVVTASAPLVEGLNRAPRRNDAEFIWLPKAERLFDEIPPIPWSAPEHAHAEYPRGWPALVAAAGAFDQPVPDEAPNVVGVARTTVGRTRGGGGPRTESRMVGARVLGTRRSSALGGVAFGRHGDSA
jgi:hypothetical protein